MIIFGIDAAQQHQTLAAFFSLPDNLALTLDAENRITAASAGLLALIGVDERGVLGQPFTALLFDADRSAVAARLQEAREQGETVRFSARLRCGDGRFVGLAWSVIQAGSEGWLVLSAHEVGVNLDNAARLSPELTDRLTGLPALALFLQRVDHGLQRLRRNPSTRFAVMSLGLDRFHLVNHRFGYWAGDLLLTEVAHRLQRNVRPTDLVSRVGGDEFCVLLEDVRDVAAPLRVVQRWREQVAVPFRVGNHELSWGFSAGVAVVDQSALSGETSLSSEAILSEAQLAMREAKRQGGAATVISDPALHLTVQQQFETEAELRAAIEQDAFEPYYQPIVDLETRAVVGFEALVRWHHPRRGVLPPAAFLEVAETSGLIDAIGKQVITKALATLRTWHEALGRATLTIAVNVSPRQLCAPGFVEWLLAAVTKCGVPPETVKVEITESAVLDQGEKTLAILSRLRGVGLQVMLDDFGTGFSSLSCLYQIPAQAIKIDRSFVAAIDTQRGYDFVRGVVDLAHALGLEVVCEGVEHEAQHAQLRALGARWGQGYLYSRPVASDQALAMLLCGQ